MLRHLQTDAPDSYPGTYLAARVISAPFDVTPPSSRAIELLDFRPLTERRQRALMRQVRHEALKAFTLNRLVEFAKRWLYERRILIPADRRVRELARTAYTETEHALLDRILPPKPKR